jgi:Ca2+-binding RTX toxin-like protein
VFSDEFYGDGDDNVFVGGDGADYFRGNGGNDTLIGGDDFDYEIFMLIGVKVRTSSDFLDYANSGSGLNVDLSTGTVSNDGMGGADTVSGMEVVRGSNNDDTLIGGNPDNDAFEMFRPRGGNDYVDGGSGFDRVRYHEGGCDAWWGDRQPFRSSVDSSAFGRGTVAAGTANQSGGGVDTLISIESIQGTNFADHLVGNSSTSTQFRPMGGDDTIVGGTAAGRSGLCLLGLRLDRRARGSRRTTRRPTSARRSSPTP